MNKKFTKLMAALALLVFMAPNMVGWGQTRDNVTVTKTMNQVVSENDYTVSAGSDVTCYTSIDLNNYINMSTSGEPNCGSFWGTTTYDWRLYQNKSGDVTITVTDGTLVSVKFTYNVNNGGTLKNGSTAVSSGTTVNASGTSITLTVGNTGNATNGQVRITAVEVVYSTGGSTTTPTTVTIDATGITNTDIYAGTAAGSLSATVTSGGSAVSGATVTWSGDNDDVATIANDGTVTLVSEGTVNFTASYAGAAGQYMPSSATYEMTVTSSAPYVQPTTIEADLNNSLFGTNHNGSVSGITDENPVSGTKDNVTITYAGGGNHYINNSQIRFYPNNKLTFDAPEGYEIKQIVFTASSWGITVKVGDETISSETKTWTGNATQVIFTGSGSSGNCQMTKATITIGLPSIVPSIDAEDIALEYDAEVGEIEYTINNPVAGGSITASCDAEWIVVEETPQTEGSFYFTCGPNSNFYAHSATVTLTYTYGDSKATVTKDVTVTQAKDPGANGSTSEYPITVSEALEAINEVGTVSGIYVGGIVSSIVSAYNNSYVTFDMYDATGDEYSLRAYHCEGEDADEVAVGDEVVVYGNLMLYNNSIYELASGCQLVSLTHHVVPAITVDPSTVNATAAGTDGTLTVTYTGIEIETSDDVEIHWFEEDGTTAATYNHDWILTEINADYNVYYVIGANNGAARTAYFKVYSLDTEANDVYSDLVTVTQAAAPQQYTLTVSELNANIDAIYVYNAADQTNALIADGLAGNAQVLEGTEILVSPVVDEGYELQLSVIDGNDNAIATTYNSEGEYYSFTMPSSNVTISATAIDPSAVVTYDFSKIEGFNTWNNSYSEHVVTYQNPNATVTFEAASKQAGTITDIPVTKGSPVTIVLTEPNRVMTSVTFVCRQWNNKAQTITLHYSTDGGENYTSTGITSDNFTISSNNLPEGTNAVKITFSSTSNQVGIESATITPAYRFTKSIVAYDQAAGTGWNFIASPIAENVTANVYAGDEGTDLYYYDEPSHTWMNYKNDHASDFTFANGVGYLYANSGDVTLTFAGTSLVANDVEEITLSYTEAAAPLAGWNLVGNPFNSNATLDMDCYTISGMAINTEAQTAGSYTVAPCEGVMVKANEVGQFVTFTKATPGQTPQPNQLQMTVAQQVVTRNGASTGSATVEDNAIVSFNEGNRLEKFAFNADAAKLYIPQNGKEYAIVSAEAQGEMPVNFRATKNGTYTLTINPEGVEMNYLHLIDNMTGANIDLLQTPSYTFNASMNDYESRFKLVFAAGSSTGSEASETFAFFANGELIVSNEGEATLQVVDMTGRILSSQSLNGNGSVQMAAPVGVYVLRLISGNEVKTQKIVVR